MMGGAAICEMGYYLKAFGRINLSDRRHIRSPYHARVALAAGVDKKCRRTVSAQDWRLL